jgi:hypothetical protein
VYLAGLEMQRSAGLVPLTLVREVAFNDMERLYRCATLPTQRAIRIADPQRDVALTAEGEAIGLELTAKYFTIDHDTGSCF